MSIQIIDIGYQTPILPLVLVVDDEFSLQTLIRDTLDADYRVVPAYNGREGIEKAEKIRPDVILMDVMMPDIGGYDAVRLLQKSPTTRDIPIIVISAQDFDDSTILLIRRESNVAGFLTKPFRPQQLRDTVRKALEKRNNPAS